MNSNQQSYAQKLFEISERVTDTVNHNYANAIVADATKHAEETGEFSFNATVDCNKFNLQIVIQKLQGWGFQVTVIENETYANGVSQACINIAWGHVSAGIKPECVSLTPAQTKQKTAPVKEKKHLVLHYFRDSWSPQDNGYCGEELYDTEAEARAAVVKFNSRNNHPIAPECFTTASYEGYTTKRLKDFQ